MSWWRHVEAVALFVQCFEPRETKMTKSPWAKYLRTFRTEVYLLWQDMMWKTGLSRSFTPSCELVQVLVHHDCPARSGMATMTTRSWHVVAVDTMPEGDFATTFFRMIWPDIELLESDHIRSIPVGNPQSRQKNQKSSQKVPKFNKIQIRFNGIALWISLPMGNLPLFPANQVIPSLHFRFRIASSASSKLRICEFVNEKHAVEQCSARSWAFPSPNGLSDFKIFKC